MAFQVADRVQVTATANTTVSFTLGSAVTGYQSFSVITNGNTTYYAATDTTGNWEVGIGTYSSSGPTLTRTTILSSSNSGSAVTFSGTVNVFVTYPAEEAVYSNGINIVGPTGISLATTNGGTGLSGSTPFTANGVVYASSTSALATGSALTFDGTSLFVQSGGTNAKFDAFYAGKKYLDFTWYGLSIGSISQDSGTYIAVNSLNALPFNISGSEQMRLTSTGLGIGTSNPTSVLSIESTNVYGGLSLNSTGATSGRNRKYIIQTDTAGNTQNGFLAFYDATASAYRMALDANGNLGIGTISPSYPLDVNGQARISAGLTISPATTSLYSVDGTLSYYGAGNGVYLNGNSTGFLALRGDGSGTGGSSILLYGASGSPASTAVFYTNSSERMRITSGGNVGIGTSSPAYSLDVSGQGRFLSNTQDQLTVGTTSSGSGASITVTSGTGTTSSKYAYISFINNQTSSKTYRIGTYGEDNFVITDGNTERLKLDTSGNLGLGVTPSAWSSSYKAFQVGSQGSFWANASGGDIYLASNYYFDGSQKYIANGYASFYSQNNGAHNWQTAGNNVSGAGASAAFTQAMTLDNSGNLGIGTTSITAFGAGYTTAQIQGVSGSGVKLYAGSTISAYMFADTNGFYLANPTSTLPIVFQTNNAEAARIDSSGNLLVGQTSQSNSEKFGVVGSNLGAMIYARNTSVSGFAGQFICDNSSWSSGSLTYFAISGHSPNNTASSFLYGTDSTSLRFQVYSNGGIANYSSNNVNLSDETMKKDIRLAGNYLDKLTQIPVKTFLFNDQTDTDLNLGVIAQDVKAVAPELVGTMDIGSKETPNIKLAIYETDLKYAMLKAIQELSAKVTALEAKLGV
jgi:hypothetical protein